MSDLYTLLDRAAGEPGAAVVAPSVLDDDLARGRRALRRRRLRRSAAGVSAGAAVAVLWVGVPSLLSASSRSPVAAGVSGSSAPAPSTSSGTPGAVPATVVATPDPQGPPLLDADPATTAGLAIRPALVPKGWSVAGNAFVLVLSPPGTPPSVDDFTGRLVVMLTTATPPTESATTTVVGDRTAVVVTEGDVLHAWLRRDDGRYLEVQAPISRGIGTDWLGRFLAGVTVTATAATGAG